MTDAIVGSLAAPGLGAGALIIERVETLALRAPLDRRYQGSAYSMDNRCTIVTRLFTADGLVSEVYSGDTDAEQALIVGIIHDELAPRVIGRSAADPEGAWRAMEPATNDILRDRGLALQAIACVDTAIWDLFGRALGLPLHRAWGSVTDALPISVIGGYYHLAGDELRDDDGELRRGRVRRGQVQGRRSQSPAEDAVRVRDARDALGPAIALMVDANQGYDRPQAVEFGRLVGDLDIRWFEEPCRWTNDRRWMRDVRYQTGHPGLRRPERDDAARDPRSHRRGRDRRLQLRRLVGRWPDGLAQGRGAGGGLRRRARPPRGATGLEPPARERSGPHVRRVLRRGAGPVLLAPDRHVDADPGRPLHLPERPGFGIELDWAYVDAHTVDRRVTDQRAGG